MSIIPNDDIHYVSSIINASIPEFKEKYLEGKTITFYTIHVVNNFSKAEWLLEKRYKEFDSIAKELLKLCPNVPQMPKKSVFKLSAIEDLNKRRIELEDFIKHCVKRKDIVNNSKFRDFLEIDKHSPELAVNIPEKIGEFDKLPLGVRDFHYSKEEGVIFLCCSDMNIISRADSMLTNLKLPWEKKSNTHIALGAAFCYKVQKLGIGWEFVKSWGKSFPTQTGVVNWDGESNTFSIGLDDGRIFVMKHDVQSYFSSFEEVTELKNHTNRIMGIGFDSNTGYVYSCSTDKRFLISEINYQSSPIEVYRSNYGYTNLVFDKPNQRIFLTNEGGEIEVYTIADLPIRRLLLLQTSSNDCIRGLHIDFKRYLIFISNTAGRICILDLGLPGKEKLINEVSNFGGRAKLRLIKSMSGKNEIVTGDEEGRVTIWDLKTGEPICMI